MMQTISMLLSTGVSVLTIILRWSEWSSRRTRQSCRPVCGPTGLPDREVRGGDPGLRIRISVSVWELAVPAGAHWPRKHEPSETFRGRGDSFSDRQK